MVEHGDNRCIIHILNDAGDFQGCGFLLNGRYAITSGKVIRSCLGCSAEKGPGDHDQEITVSFPFGTDSEQRSCRVLYCNCGHTRFCECEKHSSKTTDLALIEFFKPFNFRSSSKLAWPDYLNDLNIKLLDFTNDREPGKPLHGVLKSTDLDGLLKLEPIYDAKDGVRHGYGGAPVFDVESGLCIGLQIDPPVEPEAENAGKGRSSFVLSAAQILAELDSYDLAGRYPIRRNPYKGLNYFTADDERDFFARGQESEKLFELVAGSTIVPVIGPAGSGKTSLVHAGLIPQLTAQGWAIACVRPGPELEAALAAAILAARDSRLTDPEAMDLAAEFVRTDRAELIRCLQMTGDEAESRSALAACFGELFNSEYFTDGAPPRLLLFIDQFEEMFAPEHSEARQQLLRVLTALKADEIWRERICVVLAMQSEVYNQYMELNGLAAALEQAECKIYRLEQDRLLNIMVEPARQLNVEYAAGLPEQILADLTLEDQGLATLQLLLKHLWPRQRKYVITKDGYAALLETGGLTGLQARFGQSQPGPVAAQPRDEVRRVSRRAVVSAEPEVAVPTNGDGPAFSRKAIAGSIFDPNALQQAVAEAANGYDESGSFTAVAVEEPVMEDALASPAIDLEPVAERMTEVEPEIEPGPEPEVDPEPESELVSEPEPVPEPEPTAAATNEATDAADLAVVPEDLLAPEDEYVESEPEVEGEGPGSAESDRAAEVITWSSEAVTQAVKYSQVTAGKAEATLGAKGIDRQVPVLLAVEAARVDSNLYTNSVLRESLKLVQRSIHCFKQRGSIWATVFSPDGRLVAMAGGDRSARVREIGSGAEVLCVNHKDIVRNVYFSDDGRLLASASSDGTVLVTNVETGERVCTIDEQSKVHAVAFTRTGTLIVISSYNTAKVYRVDNGKEVLQSRHSDKIYSVAFSPDGNFVATGSHDGKIRVYSIRTNTEICSVAHDDWVISICFSHDGTMLATASGDRTARVWRISTGEELCQVKHDDWVRAVIFNHDSRFIATASGDHTASVWYVNIGKEICRIIHGDWVRSVAFNPEGDLLATASRDGTARVSEVKTGKALLNIKHGGSVHTAVFDREGTIVATASSDGTARICPLVTSDGVCRVAHDGAVSLAAFSPDGNFLLTAGADATARITWITTNQELARIAGQSAFTAADYSPDGKLLALGSQTGQVQINQIQTGAEVRRFHVGSTVTSTAFSPDSRQLAVGAADGIVAVYQVDNGTELCRINQGGSIDTLALNNTGKLLAAGGSNGEAIVYRINTGTPMLRISHEGPVNAILFNPASNLVASCGADGTVRIYRVNSGTQVNRLLHADAVNGAAFTPNGKRLVTAGADGLARLWHVESGQELYVVKHDAAVNSVRFNPDGDLFVTASADGTARIILANSGEELGCINHDGGIDAAAFNMEATQVVTCGADGLVKVNYRYTSDLLREARRRLARNLTQAEWLIYFGREPYRRTVPWLPAGE